MIVRALVTGSPGLNHHPGNGCAWLVRVSANVGVGAECVAFKRDPKTAAWARAYLG